MILALAALAAAGCGPDGAYREQAQDPELLHASVQQMTAVMIRDIFSPPQASRAYAYASVAAYEALAASHPRYRSLAGQLNGLSSAPRPDTSRATLASVASIHAFLTVAEDMVYSVDQMKTFHDDMHARFRRMGIPRATLERSVTHGTAVARHILAWADEDHYKETRSASQFTVTDDPARWRPTPPAYMGGVNPNWDKLRPFVMRTADQFKPPRPLAYSTEKGSPFFQQVSEVYEVGNTLTPEQREIAGFWNCNPYVLHTQGHAMFATKQLTPGGHWMGIAAIAARQTEADLMRTAEAYVQTAVAVADGFISAFDEKYRSALVRPETVINEHIDETWQPALQTPPFPEYPSAHSVISASAATALTDLFGPSFAFADTTEVQYGLPVRSFDSFDEAAEEAAISRIYGGIHYRMAAEHGLDQGRSLGQFVTRQVHTRSADALAAQDRAHGSRSPAGGAAAAPSRR